MKLISMAVMLVAISLQVSAELTEVTDVELSDIRGQATKSNDKTLSQLARSGHHGQIDSRAQSLTVSSTQPQSTGITLDINLQLHIDEIRWVDSDGAGSNGTQGAVSIRGFSVGHLDDVHSPAPAQIRGLTMDVDGSDGLVIGVGQIGDAHGNGIDVRIDSVQFR